MAIYDFTEGARVRGESPALLQPKAKTSWNPFHYVWIGLQHVAYFFAPANQCVYCWVWRMYVLGAASGAVAAHWWWR